MKGLLLQGTLPSGKTRCPDRVADTYVGLTPEWSFGLSAMDALEMVYRETSTLPERALWDGTHDLIVGCAHGGTVKLQTSDTTSRIGYVYQECAVFHDLIVNGTATIDQADGAFHFEGKLGFNQLVFDEDGQGHRSVDGDWKGQKVHERD